MTDFAGLELAQPILRAVSDEGYTSASPIQAKSIPPLMAGRDLLGIAQTGTGKTAAFALPMLHRLLESKRERQRCKTRALILAPTRELACQIADSLRRYGRLLPLRTAVVFGGAPKRPQVRTLTQGVDVLVATPGRLLDMMKLGHLQLHAVEFFVLDEADRMLDMGFIPDVRRIVYQTPHKRRRQTLFFSATFNDSVMRLADSWTIDPEHVVIEPDSVATDTVDQRFWMIGQDQKEATLLNLCENPALERAIIFANRRDQTHRLVKFLQGKNITCEGLAGDVPQRKRLATLNRFKDGDLRILVATDVAGRGIHVDGISHVINYSLPEEAEDYVHRIGRTGRAGATGIAISFVSEDDAFNLPAIEEYIGEQVSCTVPDLNPS